MTSPNPVPVAAIDCGTNSTRLLISDGANALERRTTITRMGQGVDATGKLHPDAIERVVDVLGEYRQLLDQHQVANARITATSAARDASNAEEFFAAAEAAIGFRPEVLSGAEEGRLSFAGATAELFDADGSPVLEGLRAPYLVVDIGGGSTELIVGNTEADGVRSLDIGCVRLSERYVENDPALPEELVACLSIAEAHLDECLRLVPEIGAAQTLIGVAGTITTAAMVEIGMADYDRDQVHHFRLDRDAAEDVFRTLATESREERLGNPGLEEARADVIVAGLCILMQVMRQFDFDECIVSESDILDGLIASQLQR